MTAIYVILAFVTAALVARHMGGSDRDKAFWFCFVLFFGLVAAFGNGAGEVLR